MIENIDDFVIENKAILQKSSNILDTNLIISQFRNYLIGQIPSLLQQMKTGKGGDVFATNAYKSLYSIIQSNLNNIGWAKKQLVKTIGEKMMRNTRRYEFEPFREHFGDVLGSLGFEVIVREIERSQRPRVLYRKCTLVQSNN